MKSHFDYVGVFNGKPYHLGRYTWNPETTTMEDVCVGIANGFRSLAEDFDFAALVEGYDIDGENPATG